MLPATASSGELPDRRRVTVQPPLRSLPPRSDLTQRPPSPWAQWLLAGLVLSGLLLAHAARGMAQESPSQREWGRLPYRTSPIHYFAPSDDPVARLQRSLLVRGDNAPRPDSLSALLAALEISETSQMLVFARNARQSRQISPDNPRAIYFNDQVSVAWTPGATNYEISAIDPLRGPVFYLVSAADLRRDSAATDATAEDPSPERRNRGPLFQRSDSCLACHIAETTRHVPGYLVRSMFTSSEGKPETGLPLVDGTTPYDQRWGGWYVSGERLPLRHRGNLATAEARRVFETGTTAVPLMDNQRLRATARHLQGTSDVVAPMVHDHQTRFQTLLTRLRYEHELGRSLDTLPDFVRTMLLDSEPPLPQPVAGRADYRAWFESVGPEASRPLRQLDLHTRLLRHPLSWLVATPQFQQLPAPLRKAIHAAALRLVVDEDETALTLSAADRQILTEQLLPQFLAGGAAAGGSAPAANP